MSKVYVITGAGRGMGVELTRAALAAGHRVVATARRPETVERALGAHDDLLALPLDITDPAAAQAVVDAALERFGRIDVLVNNAAGFQVGYFEEISDRQFRDQLEVNLFGALNVTRAVLPLMRRQRAGQIVAISSAAGLSGSETGSAYAASKFALEGWMESLAAEVAPFGIITTIVEPGFFRTELLEPASTTWSELTIDDYTERREQLAGFWAGMNGRQAGDPAKLGAALIELLDQPEPPLRWAAGADAAQATEQKANTLLAQLEVHRDRSVDLAHDDTTATVSL